MSAYDRIKALMETAADAAGGLEKLLFGDATGSTFLYPDDPENPYAEMKVPGVAWGEVFVPALIEGISTEVDALSTWGYIKTNATSVDPTLLGGGGISSISKDEGTDAIKLNFEHEYASTDDYIVIAQTNSGEYFRQMATKNTTDVEFTFSNTSGTTIDINNLYISVIVVGEL